MAAIGAGGGLSAGIAGMRFYELVERATQRAAEEAAARAVEDRVPEPPVRVSNVKVGWGEGGLWRVSYDLEVVSPVKRAFRRLFRDEEAGDFELTPARSSSNQRLARGIGSLAVGAYTGRFVEYVPIAGRRGLYITTVTWALPGRPEVGETKPLMVLPFDWTSPPPLTWREGADRPRSGEPRQLAMGDGLE